MPKPPYEPARLVNGDKPLTTRWYIVFRAWDANKECLVRKRDYSINQIKTLGARREAARKKIAKINLLLDAGYHVDPKEKKKQDVKISVNNTGDFTITQAFNYILPIIKQTKRDGTHNSYNSVSGLFLAFCEAAGWDQWKIKTLTRTDIITWLDHTKVSNTTRNNYKSFISGIFTMMAERGILEVNPALGIKSLAEDLGGNTAYTLDQIEKLKEAIQDKQPRLWLFVTFLLYGFIRPAEIGRLRVKMIDLKKNEIFLPGNITKNRKPRYVKISKPFRTYIDQLNLPAQSLNDFVFGYNLQTCSQHIQKNYASMTHTEIARKLKFGKEYTLYSWKHTGVVLHYKAGIDIKTLQAQIGHQSLQETDIYLKSLNLYTNTEIEDKSPVI